ncbi:hypothetical protein TNCV_4474631 [Trichonephila clavipes]|nr:hypothetical protein TNCV_4474631 [Trichonephila clavipes]
MAAPIEKASREETAVLSPIRIKGGKHLSQGFISAMAEFRKILPGFSGHLRCRKAFKNAKPKSEDRLDIFFGYWPLKAKSLIPIMIFSRFGLRIAAWNANGVRSRIIELRDFINKHSLDIILIQETHLRPGVSIREYPTTRSTEILRQTQNIPSGGTAILVKILSQISPHSNTDSRGGRSYAIGSFSARRRKPVLIASIYIPPHLTLRVHSTWRKFFALEHSSPFYAEITTLTIHTGVVTTTTPGGVD